jgi:NAD(P)-dependent dehydrogenase (short-subunit alcohol dehydrogenase family)
MVEYFHSKGAKVVFGDVNDRNGQAVVEKLDGFGSMHGGGNSRNVTFAHCDVTNWDELLRLHEIALEKYGTVDAVVANAGVNEMEDIFEDKFDENGRLLPPKHIVNEINLKGVFNSILR